MSATDPKSGLITANQCLENAAAELDAIDHRQEESANAFRIKVSAAWQALAKVINREQTK
jgi:hypothetical protein